MHVRCITLLIVCYSICLDCFSQNTIDVCGEYTYYTTESTSIEEAKRLALERAKIQAIADEFGTRVSQSAATSISTTNNKSDTHFFMIGTSDVNGEWIETIGEPSYSVKFEFPILIVNCKIKGKIRQILQPEIELVAKTLKNGLTSNFESTDYMDGDDLYVQFRSSVSGNILIFLVQGNTVYRLLPYKRNKIREYAIEAGKDYIFFSKSFVNSEERSIVDEYELYADREIDSANILILYTPNAIGMTDVNELIFDEPPSMDIDTFNRWFVKRRSKDKYSRVLMIPLTIRKL